MINVVFKLLIHSSILQFNTNGNLLVSLVSTYCKPCLLIYNTRGRPRMFCFNNLPLYDTICHPVDR